MEKFMELIPDEILLEIMGYLSTKDILKNLAQVSKRFHRLSKDPQLITKIELKPAPVYEFDEFGFWHGWSEERRKKYYDDFSKVLQESQKLKFLSLDFDDQRNQDYHPNEGNNVILNNILPLLNPQCIEEFSFKFRWEAFTTHKEIFL